AEHLERVRDEVRRGVDVVVVRLAVVRAHQIFHAADVDRRPARQALRGLDACGGRVVAADHEPGGRACGTGAEGSVRGRRRGLAEIGRTEIGALEGPNDADRIQRFAVENLDANDRVFCRLDVLLEERRAVGTEVKTRRRLERRRRVEAQDAGARAADVRLQQYGKAQSIDDLPDL